MQTFEQPANGVPVDDFAVAIVDGRVTAVARAGARILCRVGRILAGTQEEVTAALAAEGITLTVPPPVDPEQRAERLLAQRDAIDAALAAPDLAETQAVINRASGGVVTPPR